MTGTLLWAQLSGCIRNGFCPFDDDGSTDFETMRNATGTVTIIFAILAVVSLVGSIYGCLGTCRLPQGPTVILTTAQPGTVVTATQSYPMYNQQPPPYGQHQVLVDTKVQH